MKSHTKLKLRFRWLILLGSALAGLGLVNAPAEETTVEIVHYFNVQGQIDALNNLQTEFEASSATASRDGETPGRAAAARPPFV